MASIERLDAQPFRKENKQPTVTEREVNSPHRAATWHGEQALPHVPNWQSEISVGGATGKFVKSLGLGALFMVVPLLYIALGLVIAVFDGREVEGVNVLGHYALSSSSVVGTIHQVLKQAVSLWPTLFGIVLCATLRSAATYKAEKGTRLRTLEQMMAARSLGSVATSPLNFRKINLTTIILMALWAFSYIGTQALQRIFSTEVLSEKLAPTTVPYIDNRYAPFETPRAVGYSTTLTDVMLSAFLTPPENIRKSLVDPWYNPKIPDLDSVAHLPRDSQGWIDLTGGFGESPVEPIARYSSILGVPVCGLADSINKHNTVTDFNILTGYYSFQCEDFRTQLGRDVKLSKQQKYGYGSFACLPHNICSDSSKPQGSNGLGFGLSTRTIHEQIHGYDGPQEVEILEQVTLANWQNPGSFNPRPNESSTFEVTTCNVTPHVLEVGLSCEKGSCTASKMRVQENARQLPYLVSGMPWATTLVPAFLEATLIIDTDGNPTGYSYQASNTTGLERWLYNPHNTVNTTLEWEKFSHLPIKVFSKRLSMAFNAFWTSAVALKSMTGGPTAKTCAPSLISNGFGQLHAEARHTRYFLAYVCNWAWLGVLFACCLVLIFVIAARVYYDTNTLAPDIMGYVSALVRSNPYVETPRGGSLLDGIDVSRKLGDMKVRLHDVRPADCVGHVALATVHGEPLKRGRSYW